jgi:hypothetical protein
MKTRKLGTFWGQDLLNAPSRRQNGKEPGRKYPPPIVILPARAFYFWIKAILTSFGFDQFCPLRLPVRQALRAGKLRWQALRYRHFPAPCRLALNKIASNLEGAFNGS